MASGPCLRKREAGGSVLNVSYCNRGPRRVSFSLLLFFPSLCCRQAVSWHFHFRPLCPVAFYLHLRLAEAVNRDMRISLACIGIFKVLAQPSK